MSTVRSNFWSNNVRRTKSPVQTQRRLRPTFDSRQSLSRDPRAAGHRLRNPIRCRRIVFPNVLKFLLMYPRSSPVFDFYARFF